MKIWDRRRGTFSEYTVEWEDECEVIPADREEMCKCARCGKAVKWRESFMSHLIMPEEYEIPHEPSYAICRECAMKEAEEER